MISKLLFILISLLFSSAAFANICGTDYQNFNPTTSGLDFVTVQSSETLKPCIVNMGVFFNYAANSLTYSQTLNANFIKGQEAKDKILGADLSVGVGLTDRWDFGINVPFILQQNVKDDYYVSSYDENGATEIKINTKYHLSGDDTGGTAAILSMNQNLIEDNPFAGHGSGPTWNLELAADTTLASKWAFGVNMGYRWRDKGTPIPNVPFAPMGDQWIYSTAASYLFANIDTKVIAEVYGGRAADAVDQDTDRSLNSLEGLLGFKYDATTNLAIHFGGATQLDTSLGGPDWRLYVGMNWAIGRECENELKQERTPPVKTVIATEPETITLNIELLYGWNADQLDSSRLELLVPLFKDLREADLEKLVIEGHTDSIGVETYNLDLSQRRANNLRDHLIEKFNFSKEKIEAIGYGQTQPLADNGNFQGRRKNRRVVLKVYRKAILR